MEEEILQKKKPSPFLLFNVNIHYKVYLKESGHFGFKYSQQS